LQIALGGLLPPPGHGGQVVLPDKPSALIAVGVYYIIAGPDFQWSAGCHGLSVV